MSADEPRDRPAEGSGDAAAVPQEEKDAAAAVKPGTGETGAQPATQAAQAGGAQHVPSGPVGARTELEVTAVRQGMFGVHGSAAAITDAIQDGEPVRPTRGSNEVATFKEVSHVLAGVFVVVLLVTLVWPQKKEPEGDGALPSAPPRSTDGDVEVQTEEFDAFAGGFPVPPMPGEHLPPSPRRLRREQTMSLQAKEASDE